MKKIMIAAAAVALMSAPAFAQSGGGAGSTGSNVGPAATSSNTADTPADLGKGDSGMGDAKRESSGATMNESNKVTTDQGTGSTGATTGGAMDSVGSADTIHSSDTDVDTNRNGRSGTMSGSGGAGGGQ
ncbi:hypothetical protein [Azospirillum sp. SYSU D00513]|uniref:hypothetical protein n=1 Tax=Azospirillum sp. SYSU D00513 TaxID=2812561 RepID=UPI001A95706B|nr:hypothetical protein [Azospirillum sp. SYSU D00513]